MNLIALEVLPLLSGLMAGYPVWTTGCLKGDMLTRPYHSSEGTLGTDMRANLQLRVRAEEQYRRSQAAQKISRAIDSKTRPYQLYLPGDVVYYRRYKVPHSQEPSRSGLDHAKFGVQLRHCSERESGCWLNSQKPSPCLGVLTLSCIWSKGVSIRI